VGTTKASNFQKATEDCYLISPAGELVGGGDAGGRSKHFYKVPNKTHYMRHMPPEEGSREREAALPMYCIPP